MSMISGIKNCFKPERIIVSKAYNKVEQKFFKSLGEIADIAKQKDVFVRFSPVTTKGKNSYLYTNMEVFERGIEHVADIPEYAVKHQTGDQVYIPCEKIIAQSETMRFPDMLIEKFTSFFNK